MNEKYLRIYMQDHMAGSTTPEGMTTSNIRRLIRSAGREPYERDTLYNVITGPDADLQESPQSVARPA